MIVIGRLVSLGIDGFDQRSLVPLIVELTIAMGMFCAAKYLARQVAIS
jgi:hypothetical protein